jgi:hypothetical protein
LIIVKKPEVSKPKEQAVPSPAKEQTPTTAKKDKEKKEDSSDEVCIDFNCETEKERFS